MSDYDIGQEVLRLRYGVTDEDFEQGPKFSYTAIAKYLNTSIQRVRHAIMAVVDSGKKIKERKRLTSEEREQLTMKETLAKSAALTIAQRVQQHKQ